jgi:arsenite transporter
VLVEVPVMLSLVWFANRTQARFPKPKRARAKPKPKPKAVRKV